MYPKEPLPKEFKISYFSMSFYSAVLSSNIDINI
jgi:hypothetical protein